MQVFRKYGTRAFTHMADMRIFQLRTQFTVDPDWVVAALIQKVLQDSLNEFKGFAKQHE